nr:retrovirus-related Pol polyprotein from transposon TNT 1-94 [Tanacetum cinerariifolium]
MNDLLEQAINKDIVNIVVTATVNECERRVTLETELQKDFIKKECYDKLFKQYTALKKHCISLEVDTQLEHKKHCYEKRTCLQEKDLVITALKDTLRKLKGKAVVDEAVTLHLIDPELLKIDVAPLAPKLQNNRTIHFDYFKHTQEETAILREIVKNVVQIILWYLDSGCSKYMTGDRSQLTNFVNKFLGMVKFDNDHVAKIMGYGDYKIGNVTILKVCFVEGLGHNLFSVEQFCDSDIKVAFRQHTCFIRNLKGVDLLNGSRGNNLYTLSLGDMMSSSPICLLSKASKTKSWLWYRRLSHLNFGAINHLARQGLVQDLPKLKFEKDHICSACAMGKSKKKFHKPKSEDTNQEKLYLLHVDLYGPMRVKSINGKKYILVIVGISHETLVARSPQQNGVIERRNRTLIKAARTMLIYAQAPLFLWAEVVATACYTQNRSIVRLRHGKTPYELLHDKLPDLSFLHVFGALCYPTNDSENLGKLQPKADIRIFIGYPPTKKAFRIYNRCTIRIVETIHVDFDELTVIPVDPPTSKFIAPLVKVIAPEPAESIGSPSSTTVDQDAPSLSKSQTTSATQPPVIPRDVEDDNPDIKVAHTGNDPLFGMPIPEVAPGQSSSTDSIHTAVHPDYQISQYNSK